MKIIATLSVLISVLCVKVNNIYAQVNAQNSSSNVELCLRVTNTSSDKLSVKFYGRKKNVASAATGSSATTSTGKFTIILLPDTQYYTAEPQGTKGGSNVMFKRQTNWIVNNRGKKNIVYVGQLGDCVNNGDKYEVEWKRADTAIKKLENPTLTGLTQGIPYAVCVGNHDQTPNGSATGTTTFYNKYFGSKRFAGRSYYGGHFGTNNDNSYDLFSVGNIDFLVICFEFDPTTNFTRAGGALDWGENLVKNHPNRNVIVLSHYVLKANAAFSTQGYNIYQRLKVYPNFKFMSGGHVVDTADEAMRKSTYNGKTVYTVLSNYQDREKGGNGRLRIYEFDPSTNNVSVKTYSPYTRTYEKDANSQFNMNISLIKNSTLIANADPANSNLTAVDTFHLISELNNVQSGTDACVSWTSLNEDANYEWYAEVSDGTNKSTSSTTSFKAVRLSSAESNNVLLLANKQNNKANTFKIYPNPARDILRVETNNSATFSLIDQSGKVLVTTNITGEGSINISGITPGLYYLKNNSTGSVQKVVIAR